VALQWSGFGLPMEGGHKLRKWTHCHFDFLTLSKWKWSIFMALLERVALLERFVVFSNFEKYLATGNEQPVVE
jgi:hypothetical protein